MLRRLYDRCMQLAAHRHAPSALFGVSFAESSFFPIPPDVMLIPMVLAERAKAWAYAAICTIGSILGGIAGYAIGYFLFEAVGQTILEFYHATEKFESVRDSYNAYGAWIVFTAGFTPIPYKVFTIASGVTGLNLVAFTLASLIGRGLRFFLVAGLLYLYGPPIRAFIERRLGFLTILFVVMLFAGFLALRWAS